MPWGDGRVFRRGNVFWVAYYCDGKEIRESSRSTNERIARTLLKKRIAGVITGTLAPHEGTLRYEDLEALIIEDYQINERRSAISMRCCLRHLRAFFQGASVMRMTNQRVRDYVLHRKTSVPPAKNATINRELSMLKRMFSLAVQVNRVSRPPFIPMLSERNARQGFFDDEAFLAVRAKLPEELRGYVSFLYLSGWRKGEACNLQWRDVDWEGRVIRLRHEITKTGEPRTLALAGELLSIIQTARSRRRLDCPFVFHMNGRPFKNDQLWRIWRRACRLSGHSGKLIHDLRRTAIRNMIRSGVPQSVAMAMSGHRTYATFQRYNITSEADLTSAQERLTAYLTFQRGQKADIPGR